jgi:hypothetical protein
VQEIKTTGATDLNYADRLIEDYGKLFGTDIQFTLQTRLGVAANQMDGMNVDYDLCCRTTQLGGISPVTSPRIRLIPTLVHDDNAHAPVQRLVAVRQTLVSAEGWTGTSVRCWSIALDHLDDRLARLSCGLP